MRVRVSPAGLGGNMLPESTILEVLDSLKSKYKHQKEIADWAAKNLMPNHARGEYYIGLSKSMSMLRSKIDILEWVLS